ncbi:MAG: hypothetical protein C4344_03985, partial [Acidimicrobiia bacterium]
DSFPGVVAGSLCSGDRGEGGHAMTARGEWAALAAGLLDDAVVRAIVEEAPDGIVLTDEDGRIVLVNRQTERLFG